MGFWDRLLKTEQTIRKRVENAFGYGAARTPLELRREILEQIESRIVVAADGNRFPYERIIVRLLPATQALGDIFESAFLQDESLKSDILETLKESQARAGTGFEVDVRVMPAPESAPPEDSPAFELEFERPGTPRERAVPGVKLAVVKGSAEQPEYIIRKDNIMIGRLSEVLDREGRLIRKNDIVFLDNGEDVNSTVGRAHARIRFDRERWEYWIADESSRYGTYIVREGRSIEVPGGNARGIRLRPGDEICLGQACLHFETVQLQEK